MNKGLIVRAIAIGLMFRAVGLAMFAENVRTVQGFGLFFSGVVCGVSPGIVVSSLRSGQTKT
jgi:hypothetical protein